MSTPAPFQFGLSSMLLITTLVAVIMSVSVMVPGIGIALAIVSLPALVRTYVLIRRRRDEGTPVTSQEKAVLFMVCLATATLIAVAAGAAFFVTCFAGFFVGSATSGGGMSNSLGTGFAVGAIAGTCVALPLLIFFLRKWFKQPADKPGLIRMRREGTSNPLDEEPMAVEIVSPEPRTDSPPEPRPMQSPEPTMKPPGDATP